MSYFKVKPETGLSYKTETCFCPCCGHQATYNHFYMKDQNKYAKSVARKYIADSFHNELKKLETKNNSGARNVIGISVKVKRGRASQIYTYIEHKLETDIICNNCSLEYFIYGKFAFCPDCGEHNSLQILIKNFEMIDKLLAIAMEQSDKDIAKALTEDALEDCISAFDGYGKEICHVNGGKSNNHTRFCLNYSDTYNLS